MDRLGQSITLLITSLAIATMAQASETDMAFEYLNFKNAPPTNQINPFTTDGCSSFPDGLPSKPDLWVHCCVDHDWKYWAGGIESDRLKADKELAACVASSGQPVIAKLMYLGVRANGGPDSLASWRWGYGWPYAIGYTPLTQEQRVSVDEMKAKYHVEHATKNESKSP